MIRTAFNTISKYQEYIFNALTVTLSYGHLEATNNIIKSLKRTEHGYTNFRRLRLRTRYILLSKIRQIRNIDLYIFHKKKSYKKIKSHGKKICRSIFAY
ncbi:transposase [Globicatella sanguinis]